MRGVFFHTCDVITMGAAGLVSHRFWACYERCNSYDIHPEQRRNHPNFPNRFPVRQPSTSFKPLVVEKCKKKIEV